LNVSANDTDIDGSIDVATVDLDPNTKGVQTSLKTTDGKWNVTDLGIVTFVPALNFTEVSIILDIVKDNLSF
jgi:hypothetical protein